MQNGFKIALGLTSLIALFSASGCAQHTARVADPQAPAGEPALHTAPGGAEPASAAAEPIAIDDAALADAAPTPAADPGASATADTPPSAPAAADSNTSATAATPTAADTSTAAAPTAGPVANAGADNDKQKREFAAKLLAMPPQEITNAMKMMATHPRVRWLSSTGQYAYYVGGEFNAEYNPGKKRFTIKSDAGQEQAVTCEYNDKGELVNNKKGDQNMKAECNSLVGKLASYLSN